MSRIDYKNAGSILNPLKSLSFFARPAVTEPLEPRRAALRYRGFHLNDWEKCVGCSTCQKVCDNAAITMVRVPSLPEDPLQGVRNPPCTSTQIAQDSRIHTPKSKPIHPRGNPQPFPDVAVTDH